MVLLDQLKSVKVSYVIRHTLNLACSKQNLMKPSLLLILLFFALSATSQVNFNGNLEDLNQRMLPKEWLVDQGANHYIISTDSTVKRQGKRSLKFEKISSGQSEGFLYRHIKQTFEGNSIMLIASIRTEKVANGRASLFLSVNGAEGNVLTSKDLRSSGPIGTTDWKEYMVEVPYNRYEANSITVAASLNGDGKMWVDSIKLYVDHSPINQALVIPPMRATIDTSFSSGSGFKNLPYDTQTHSSLALLCQLWGFLKYHHPTIAKGELNWDNELFRILPQVLNAKSNAKLSDVFENWITRLGPLISSEAHIPDSSKPLAVTPDYGDLFSNKILSNHLKSKLQAIAKYPRSSKSYYIDLDKSAPRFMNERSYSKIAFPDAGCRFLAFCRYWAAIQYFYPYRHLMSSKWTNTLKSDLRNILSAQDLKQYTYAMTSLISKIEDTHGFIYSNMLDKIQGQFMLPIRARWIQGKLAVTGYYKDTLDVTKQFKPGDLIYSINGIEIADLVKRYKGLVPASNEVSMYRDLIRNYILRSNTSEFTIKIKRSGNLHTIQQTGLPSGKIDWYKADFGGGNYDTSFTILDSKVGYIQASRFKARELTYIENRLKMTKGLIIDLRGYPSDELIYDDPANSQKSLVNYVKRQSSPFVKFSNGTLLQPGKFVFDRPREIGSSKGSTYPNPVIVLVNEYTQSNAEFVAMALQSAENVQILGSQTAGADGNITGVNLPGGISTSFSGLGVYYPDGNCAQKVGVKIDIKVQTTLRGLIEGRDEQLEAARSILSK